MGSDLAVFPAASPDSIPHETAAARDAYTFGYLMGHRHGLTDPRRHGRPVDFSDKRNRPLELEFDRGWYRVADRHKRRYGLGYNAGYLYGRSRPSLRSRRAA